MSKDQLKQLLGDLKKGLEDLYHTKLKGLYVFGSYARGTQETESDLDVLIVLDDFRDYGAEINRTGKLISDLSLQNDVSISIVFVRELEWRNGQNPFLRNIRQEAIAAWKKTRAAFLSKAERSLQTAKSLLQSADVEFVTSRAYYAMFYIAEALLNEKNLSFRKHSGVHRALGEHFVKTGELDKKFHRWWLESFNKRLISDYAFEAELSGQDAKESISHAEEFLQVAKQFLIK